MALTPKAPNNSKDKQKPSGGAASAEDEILMREIDEAVRQDDAQQFVRKYGVAIGGVLALLLVGFAGYLFWDNQREGELEQQSEVLIAALDQAQARDFGTASDTAQALVDDASPAARTAARFLQAAAALEQGESGSAVELYSQIVADEQAPAAMRDLALIREIAANFDDRDPAEVISRLEGLAVPGNAFFGSAAELTAVAYLETGDRAQAGALFAEIAKDEEQPETLRARARQMAGLLGVDAIEDVEQLLADEGIDPEAGLTQLPQ